MTFRYLLFALLFLLLLSGCPGGMPGLFPQPSRNEGVLALIDQANLEASQGRLPEAGESLERALRIEPRNPVLWQKLAQVRLEQKEYRQAENLAAKSNALAGPDRRLKNQNWRIIGQARQDSGDEAGAQEAFSRMNSE